MELMPNFKRKTRGSSSSSSSSIETHLPDFKHSREDVLELQDGPKDHMESAIGESQDKATSEQAMSLESKSNEILSKLSKLKSTASQIQSLHVFVDDINRTVANLKGEFRRLEEELKAAVSSTDALREGVQERGQKRCQGWEK